MKIFISTKCALNLVDSNLVDSAESNNKKSLYLNLWRGVILGACLGLLAGCGADGIGGALKKSIEKSASAVSAVTNSDSKTDSAPEEISLVWERPLGDYSDLLRPTISGDLVCAVNANGEAFFINIVNGEDVSPSVLLFDGGGVVTGATACDDEVVVAAREDGMLFAAKHNGEILWQLETKTRITSPALVKDGNVFVQGHDGRLSAYSARLGNLLWRYVSPLKNLLRVPLDSSPISANDIIYAGIDNGVVVALRRESGRIIWHTRIATARSSHSFANILDVTTPVVRGNILCAASYQGHAGCLTIRNGDILWRKPLSAVKRVTMDDEGERVFAVSESGQIFAYLVRSGKLLWKSEEGAGAVVAAADGLLYTGNEKGLFILSATDGSQMGFRDMNGEVSFIMPLLDGGVLGSTSAGRMFRAVANLDN